MSPAPTDKYAACLESISTSFDWRRPARGLFAKYCPSFVPPDDGYVPDKHDKQFATNFDSSLRAAMDDLRFEEQWAESNVQAYVLAYARQQLAPYLLDVIFSVVNEKGAARTGKGYSKDNMTVQQRGLVCGISDLVLPLPAGGFGALFLEVKAHRNRTKSKPALSKIQMMFGQQIAAAGNLYVVAWGVVQGCLFLQAYIDMWKREHTPHPLLELVPPNLRFLSPDQNLPEFDRWIYTTRDRHRLLQAADEGVENDAGQQSTGRPAKHRRTNAPSP